MRPYFAYTFVQLDLRLTLLLLYIDCSNPIPFPYSPPLVFLPLLRQPSAPYLVLDSEGVEAERRRLEADVQDLCGANLAVVSGLLRANGVRLLVSFHGRL